jgi:hypothetical protein
VRRTSRALAVFSRSVERRHQAASFDADPQPRTLQFLIRALTLACVVLGFAFASEATAESASRWNWTWTTIERVDKLSSAHGPMRLTAVTRSITVWPSYYPDIYRGGSFAQRQARVRFQVTAPEGDLGRRLHVSGWVTCEVDGKFIAERFNRAARLSQEILLPGSTIAEATTACTWVVTGSIPVIGAGPHRAILRLQALGPTPPGNAAFVLDSSLGRYEGKNCAVVEHPPRKSRTCDPIYTDRIGG